MSPLRFYIDDSRVPDHSFSIIAFLSVEESTVNKLNLQGRVVDQYDFGRIKLHDVAVTPDSLRIVGVGPLLESPTGLQPSKSRVEKRLAGEFLCGLLYSTRAPCLSVFSLVYNLETKQVERWVSFRLYSSRRSVI